jgi:hypothetical protein
MRAVGRLIWARQEKRLIKNSIQELKFNILQDVRYEAMRVAADLACQRSALLVSLNLTTVLFLYIVSLYLFIIATLCV